MKIKQDTKPKNIRSILTQELELPNLFTQTDLRISVSQGICINGIVEIESYTPQKTVLRMQNSKIVIIGDDLQIDCCENGMAVVHGLLLDISFSEGGAFRC